MSEGFNPYHVWLGIPLEEQPPNLYRLLGLPLFESNSEAIEHAADQRMAYVRTFQAGRHGKQSQKVLNELATARVRLLNADKKAAYDQQLRRELESKASSKSAAGARSGASSKGESLLPAQGDGHLLGEYQLQEKLGEGGMGTVYRALHTKLGRVVALKVLPKDRVWDDRAVARFEREMKAAGAVDHPNIVRAMDAREVNGTRFLVMEYVDGVDLNELGRQCHPLPIPDICEIVRQSALGLEEIHRHGLVHRDVKPSNVMLTSHGVVKLLDLGLARFEFDESSGDEVTDSGLALGTIDYMAPEQISDSRLVDIRADIYSLGFTFYKLLTGRTPFADCKGPAERLVAHTRMPPPPVQQLRKDVPEDVVRVLERMIAKSALERYETPAKVADAVGRLAAGASLRLLVARARNLPPPEPLPDQVAVPTNPAVAETDDGTSSSMSHFFQQIVSGSPSASSPPPATPLPASPSPAPVSGTVSAPPRQPATSKPVSRSAIPVPTKSAPRKKNWTVFAASGGVGVILVVAILTASGVFTGKPAEAVLIFDWPESQRSGAAVAVDNAAINAPMAGPVRHRCSPGEHTITGVRPGFRPLKQTVQLKPGEERTVAVTWLSEPNLCLEWPAADRAGARLAIDGTGQDITALSIRSKSGCVQLTLKAGTHQLLIQRLGYQPFEQEITITDGRETVVRPVFNESGFAGGTGTVAPPPKPRHHDPKPDSPPSKPEPPSTPDDPKPTPKPSAAPDPTVPQLAQLRAMEAKYTKALAPVEELAVAWDFQRAVETAGKISLDEPALGPRLQTRRDELKRLAGLKVRIIARINESSPRLKKSALGLRGLNADISQADDAGLNAQHPGGKAEVIPWPSLGLKAVQRLLQIATDVNSPEDWIAAALLSQVCRDEAMAEGCFHKAEALGAKLEPHLVPQAAAALAQVADLLDRKAFREVDAALSALDQKFGKSAWYASQQQIVVAVRARTKVGLVEARAEALYSEAVALFDSRQYFDLKPVVERLKSEFPTSSPVTDGQRQPPLSQMELMLGKLGKSITVRLDGQGDHKTIQAAIDAAPPRSLIEIQDNGPYTEALVVPGGKQELTVRGKKGCWPILTVTSNTPAASGPLLVVNSPDFQLERVIVAHESPADRQIRCVIVNAGPCRLRAVLIAMHGSREGVFVENRCELSLRDCLLAADLCSPGRTEARNCLFLNPLSRGGYELRQCTLRAGCDLTHGGAIEECVVAHLPTPRSALPQVKNSDVFDTEPLAGDVELGAGSFSANPQFRDPTSLDFRPKPDSPCAAKASDGKELGCRYSPEIVELCKQAAELRRRGVVKF